MIATIRVAPAQYEAADVLPTAYDRIFQLLGLDDKLSFEAARYRLTPLERYLLDLIRHGRYLPQDRAACAPSAARRSLVIYLKQQRVGIKPWNALPQQPAAYQFAVELSADDWERSLVARSFFAEHTRVKMREVEAFLAQAYEALTLAPLLDRLAAALEEHPAAVAFIDDRVYSSASWCANYPADQRSGLALLRDLPPHRWPEAEQQFVFAIHTFLLAGGTQRLQTIDRMQLDPISLEEYLQSQAASYAALLAGALPSDFARRSIQAKAQCVKLLQARATQQALL